MILSKLYVIMKNSNKNFIDNILEPLKFEKIGFSAKLIPALFLRLFLKVIYDVSNFRGKIWNLNGNFSNTFLAALKLSKLAFIFYSTLVTFVRVFFRWFLILSKFYVNARNSNENFIDNVWNPWKSKNCSVVVFKSVLFASIFF